MNKMAVIVTTLTISILGIAMIGSIFSYGPTKEGLDDLIIDPGPIDQDPEADDPQQGDPPPEEDQDPPNDGRDDLPDGGGVVTPPEPPDFPVDDPLPDPPPDNSTDPPVDVPGNSSDDEPDEEYVSPFLYNGTVVIEGVGTFPFDPSEIHTVREDIFQKGYFSLFDILVHLGERGDIEFEYHFDEDMDTHLIDEINDLEEWWYWSYYDGGWREDNAWRMDMYPYKDNTTIHVHREDPDVIDEIHDVFEEEVLKREENDGKVMIDRVILHGNSFDVTIEDVEVTAHGQRNDTFKEGIITAIDVIMSLGDQGKITYDLSWYETIGSADIVKNYFVTMINGDEAYGTCGFVYETGYFRMNYRNHIHIPSDHRVIVSPEYVEYFWICL
jgi:hypothetical protein